MVAAALAAGTVFGACPAAAQVAVDAGVAKEDGDWGGEFGVNYSLVQSGGFAVTPGVGLFVHDDDNPRYFDDDDGMNSGCRDGRTGNFVDDDKCDDSAVSFYGKVEATYTVPMSVTLGVGARLDDDLRPYGTISYPLLPMLNVKGNIGDGYYAAGLQAKF
ncbi:hypothetical protein D6851_12465 [Altericroceibacterium spongiae]|uniref:Outer membrane beta-barrel protein n=1 Tax=Altericroceibacterium spongiae TaxID=2320269 RepID=A0A420EFG3_9SPHN|nr:hypothetical protein D6851_12465 [Altericroceibacterium spongiae]